MQKKLNGMVMAFSSSDAEENAGVQTDYPSSTKHERYLPCYSQTVLDA
jgi:hypothetical protein